MRPKYLLILDCPFMFLNDALKCCWEVYVQEQDLTRMGSIPRMGGRFHWMQKGPSKRQPLWGLLLGFGHLPRDESPNSGQ